VLDTVQQALMQVLDRIEQLEELHAPAAAVPEAPAFIEIPISAPPIGPAPQPSERDALPATPAKAERPPAWDIPSLPAAPSQPSRAAADADDADLSPVERMRRDFIADAQRAKLKAASSWADGANGETTKSRRPMAADVAEAASNSVASLRSRLFGVSPKLLAAALGIIVAINGGLLLMSRKTPAPPIAVEGLKEPTASLPAERSSTTWDADTAIPEHYGERAAAKQGGRLEAHDELDTPDDDALSTPAEQMASGAADNAPYESTSETTVETEVAGLVPAAIPRGTTVDTPQISVTDETLAALYQQQVLAGLSANLGNAASRAAQSSTTPEQTGSTEASYTPPEFSQPSDASADGARSSKLDLPPPTVGPLSLRLAAAAGDRSAEFEVGSRLAEGKGTNQNFKEAIRWYQRSATQGFAQAQYRIGTLYERGLGVQKDLGRARVWYQRAAEHGNVKAMHNLAVLSAGGEGGGPDYAGATSWFMKAAEHGLPDSQYNLAVLFENGLGVPQDAKIAYKWYALAARGGDKDAIVRRDAVKAALSPADLKKAEALVTSFAPKPADPLANDARAAGEDWKKRAHSDGNG
jgi:localization factor PodJL